jgi:predicted Zn-dependent protease
MIKNINIRNNILSGLEEDGKKFFKEEELSLRKKTEIRNKNYNDKRKQIANERIIQVKPTKEEITNMLLAITNNSISLEEKDIILNKLLFYAELENTNRIINKLTPLKYLSEILKTTDNIDLFKKCTSLIAMLSNKSMKRDDRLYHNVIYIFLN